MSQTGSIRELRNHGGDVLAEVERGESVIVTRDGRPVAELRPLPRRGVSAAALIPLRLTQTEAVYDIDATIDMSL